MLLLKQVKLNMDEYRQRKQFGGSSLSSQEKESRILTMAKKLNIKIGAHYDKN